MKIVVHARWDSSALPFDYEVHRLAGVHDGASEPTLIFYVFYDTGDDFCGYHYDPVFPSGADAEGRGEGSPDAVPPPSK